LRIGTQTARAMLRKHNVFSRFTILYGAMLRQRARSPHPIKYGKPLYEPNSQNIIKG
jgi:hypothetical protein